jgi:hypothetical protein
LPNAELEAQEMETSDKDSTRDKHIGEVFRWVAYQYSAALVGGACWMLSELYEWHAPLLCMPFAFAGAVLAVTASFIVFAFSLRAICSSEHDLHKKWFIVTLVLSMPGPCLLVWTIETFLGVWK